MTIQDVDGALWIPWIPSFNDTSNDESPDGAYSEIGFSPVSIDGAGEIVAVVLCATKDGTLDQFEFSELNSGIPSGSVVRYSFQSVGSDGYPIGTGTYFRTLTPSFPPISSWAETGILSTDGTDTGDKMVVTRGQVLACVIEWQNFASAPDQVNLGYARARNTTSNRVLQYATGTWSEANYDGAVPAIALRYSDDTYSYQPGVVPSHNFTIHEFSGNQEEWGMAFTFSAPVRLGGVVIRYSLYDVAVPPDAKITLYDKDFYTILEQVDLKQSVLGSYQNYVFSQEYVLDGNETYRIVISLNFVPGNSGAFYSYEVENADLLSVVDGGVRFYLTQRNGSVVANETWVDDVNSRPLISLMITGVDHDTSGGSGE